MSANATDLLDNARARLLRLTAPWTVEGLPEGFDQSETRFEAIRLKWNMDREGQDWPNPRFIAQADGGYVIFAEGVFDHGEGPNMWAMEAAPT